ncbi:NADH-dependent flavin oxidoreductase [Exophiala oligosperma]
MDSSHEYTEFRSISVQGLPFFTPKQRLPVGTAILRPEEGVTENNISRAFKPITIRGTTFQNRIWVAPMCMYSCEDGMFSDFHVAHYGQFAMRGAALITLEATAGKNTPQDAGLWKDEQIEPLRRIVNLIHSQSQKAGIQLQHAGRKAGICPPWLGLKLVPDEFGGNTQHVQAPTAEPWNENYATPAAMTEEEICETIESYGAAARRAVEAGVDVLAVHGAHGYLIHSFASPASNMRTDKWGGSFENRVRFGVEIVRAIRKNIPPTMPLLWKLSAVDWLPAGEGWDLEDTLRYVPILAKEGVDLIDTSSGGTDRRQKVQLGQQYQVPFAQAIKSLGIPDLFVAAVGWIRDGATVHDILNNDKADVVHVAREFLRDPNFVQKVALATGTEVSWIDQYHRAPMNGKYVESTTTITTEKKADDNVTKTHDSQATNKVIT